MAYTTEIAWGDGSGDKIYLTYDALEGNQIVLVSSDALVGGGSRTKDITFTATAGGTTITRVLTVKQGASSGMVVITFNDTAITTNDTAVGFNETT